MTVFKGATKIELTEATVQAALAKYFNDSTGLAIPELQVNGVFWDDDIAKLCCWVEEKKERRGRA